MTGRGAGYCAGYSTPGYMNNGIGRCFAHFGRGLGLGNGRGWRNIFRATGLTGRQRAGITNPDVSSQNGDLDALKQRAESLGENLREINRRIEELQNVSTK